MQGTQNNIPKELLQKIEKLINLRDGAKEVGSLAESENASSKITQLMNRYNLDMEAVEGELGKKKWAVKSVGVIAANYNKKNEGNWILSLYNCIARFNFVQIIHSFRKDGDWKEKMGMICLVGREVNIEVVDYLCQQLITKIRVAESKEWSIVELYSPVNRPVFRRNFFQGAISGIYNRLYEEETMRYAKERREQEKGIINKNQTSLIVVEKRKQEIHDYIEETVGQSNIKKVKNKPRKKRNTTGFKEGYKAGSSMSMHEGIEKSKNKSQIK